MAEGSESGVAPERRADAEGASVGEAKWRALKELESRFPGVTAECVRFDVVAEGGDGQPARVSGEVDEEAWRAAAAAMPDEPAERLRAVVTRVVQELGLEGSVDVVETEDELTATVSGEELGLLIGKHGATIDALQHLALRIAYKGATEGAKQVVVDAAGYRDRRREALHRAADRAAAEARRYGRAVELEPMRPLERKVVHLHLRDRTDIETHSEGDEPERRLVVTPVGRPRE